MEKNIQIESDKNRGPILNQYPINRFSLILHVYFPFSGFLFYSIIIPFLLIYLILLNIYHLNLWHLPLIVILPISEWFSLKCLKILFGIIRLRNGLIIYQNGVLFPASDAEYSRPKLTFILFKNIDAILFITEKDYDKNIENKSKIIFRNHSFFYTQLNRYPDFNMEHDSLPNDILYVRLFETNGAEKREHTTSSIRLQNGHEAMKCLMENIIRINTAPLRDAKTI